MAAESLNIVEQLKSCGLEYGISATEVRRVAAWADECEAAGIVRSAAVDLACRLYANRNGAPLAQRAALPQAATPQAAKNVAAAWPTDEEKALAAEIVKFASIRR